MTVEVGALPPADAHDARLVSDLVDLINEAYARGEAGLWLEGACRTDSGEIGDAIRSGGMITAIEDGALVGCAYVRPLPSETADVGLLAAAPEVWGGGAGRALMRAAEERARSRGFTAMQVELLVPKEWVHAEKERLHAWYTRLGYRFVRRAPFDEVAAHLASQLATPCEFLILRKRLGETPG